MNGTDSEEHETRKYPAYVQARYARLAYLLNKSEWNLGYPISIGLLLFSALAAAGVVLQSIYVRWALDETQKEFKASQRAYMVLGSTNGTLAELINVKKGAVIKIHFTNAGNGTARYFAVRAFVGVPGYRSQSQGWGHRHQWASPSNHLVQINSMAPTLDLAGKAEHIEYLSDVESLTLEQLKAAGTLPSDLGVSVRGEMEYCDEFGVYHCQSFGIIYRPSLDTFVPEIGTNNLRCMPTNLDMDWTRNMRAQGNHETPACQSDDTENRQ